MESEDVIVEEQVPTEVVLDEEFEAEYGSKRKNEHFDIEDYLYEEWRDRQWSKRQVEK